MSQQASFSQGTFPAWLVLVLGIAVLITLVLLWQWTVKAVVPWS